MRWFQAALLPILGLALAACGTSTYYPLDDDSAAGDDDAADDDASDDDGGDDDGGDDDGGDDDVSDDDMGDDDTSGPPCSQHGTLMTWGKVDVCACDPGFTPSNPGGMNCVPTPQVCKPGPIDLDVDGDGVNETQFTPTVDECVFYEMVSYERATHDDQGSPECHTPLLYDVEWSAHARQHARIMAEQANLFSDDLPPGNAAQNIGFSPPPIADIHASLMAGDHCPAPTTHCNVMSCGMGSLGIGLWDPGDGVYWFTQNIF